MKTGEMCGFLPGSSRALIVLARVTLLLSSAAASAAEVIDTDICVFGGTSGGVIAAVQAKRLGKSVALVAVNHHVGGMTSGGLGATDVGDENTIGGLARDFYRRISAKYGGNPALPRFNFEPHVAEDLFNEFLTAEGIVPHFNQRLAQVMKAGARIQWIAMDDGTVYRAKMFIDATYEGDLLALAGVSFTVGREAAATYSESLNGVRANTPSHQFTVNVDPYVVPGSPASGLLPFIQAGDGGVPGSADSRIQAYNYRLCLTTNSANRLPIPAPPGYAEADYELLGRLIDARLAAGNSLNLRSFMNIASMPNAKTDINNNGAFSTDFIGMNYEYPTASYARRAEIELAHRNYTQGFIYYLGHSTRVPAAIRTEMLSYGFCADEYVNEGHWSHQLYIREGRRMVSDYVMTQQNCQGAVIAGDPVALGSYNMDSHNAQRIVAANGFVRNEGDVQVGVSPYGISYRSLTPRTAECENLLVCWALSASHIAFGSIRMEPVHMMLAQSAATAAAFCIDDRLSVQQLDYGRLRLQLESDGQILQLGGNDSGIIVDNADANAATISGNWTGSTSITGYYGSNYLHDGATAKGTRSVTFSPNLPAAGAYDVFVRWTADPNRSTNVPIDLVTPTGTITNTFNQRQNGGTWVSLGRADLPAGPGGSVVVRTAGTAEGTYVIADAARWVPVNGAEPPVEIVASRGIATEDGTRTGLVTVLRSAADSANALPVAYATGGSARNAVDVATLPGTITIPAGARSASILVQAVADPEIEGDELFEINLQSGAGYSLGPRTSAHVRIVDRPFDEWRKNHFTAAELLDPQVSGPGGNPDDDALPNEMEFFHAQDPKSAGHLSQIAVTAIAPDNMRLRFRRSRQLSASAYDVLTATSLDPANWIPRGALKENVFLEESDDQSDVVEIAIPTEGATQMFARLRLRPAL
jgi:hypothetical protein